MEFTSAIDIVIQWQASTPGSILYLNDPVRVQIKLWIIQIIDKFA